METIFRFSRDEISRSSRVQSSSPEIKSISTYISHRNGKGAVRDVISHESTRKMDVFL
jgi:3-deoxy-D-manno-octulosonate 8-phosphate phosphatase KdsC-like HAD superfamily phosphatase